MIKIKKIISISIFNQPIIDLIVLVDLFALIVLVDETSLNDAMTIHFHSSGVKIDAQGGSVIVPGKVGGLCGNFNGRDTDEFTKNTWPAG